MQAVQHRIHEANSIEQLREFEAAAANSYWSSWEKMRINFGRKKENVLEHWKTFGKRSSPITGQPRLAANPANALLNYLYAILEAETRIACLTVGLDPGLGIIHADQKARASMALDLMEAVRPDVDGYVLQLIQGRTFDPNDFHETPQGVCRVLSPLSHYLIQTAPDWAHRVAPVVERVAKMLLGPRTAPSERVPTPLTQDNRSLGRDGVRKGSRRSDQKAKHLPKACLDCGRSMAKSKRIYCNDCLSDHKAEKLEKLIASGPAALARMREKGLDPMERRESQRKIAEANRIRREEGKAWEMAYGEWPLPDPQIFTREILPGLQSLSLKKLSKASGLSVSYCALIKKGKKIPHPMHWQNLKESI